jgi:hypothetical protein
MKYLHAEFLRPEDAASAISGLAATGVSRSAMELYSLRPVDLDPAPLPKRSYMSLTAVLSAIAVGGGATTLMYWAQRDYPLVTGGMPINSGWATGVVTFETTMAGAVIGIFAALLWESGLIRRGGRTPVPSLPDEGVVLQVAVVRDIAEIQESLRAAGAITLEVVGNER